MAGQPAQPYSQVPDGFEVVSSTFWGSPVYRNKTTGQLFCPGYTGNTFASAITDYVVIGDYTTPGVCEVKCDKQREVDKKKIKGADGARITLAGLEPANVDIKIKIWTPQQLLELDKLRAIIFPGRQKVTKTIVGGQASSRTTVTPNGSTTTSTGTGSNERFTTTRNY